MFTTEHGVFKHVTAIHTINKQTCPHCGLVIENKRLFEYHLKQHNPNKKYKCKFCEKSFHQSHHLITHERTHTGQRPFLCDICGRGIVFNLTLKNRLNEIIYYFLRFSSKNLFARAFGHS